MSALRKADKSDITVKAGGLAFAVEGNLVDALTVAPQSPAMRAENNISAPKP